MSSTLKIYLAILCFIFAFITLIEYGKTPPLVWHKTYNETHKYPYGTFVLNKELKNIFPNSDIKYFYKSPYEYLIKDFDSKNTNNTYIHISENNSIDETSAKELLLFSKKGNTVFLATNSIPKVFKDKLNINTSYKYSLKGKAKLKFFNPKLSNSSLSAEKGLNHYYFSKFNSDQTTVLGSQVFEKEESINFIKVKYHKGYIYLHLQPVCFTNYYLLNKTNKNYAASALSYINKDNNLIIDSVIKPDQTLSNSKLRFILNHPGLKYAWFLSLASLFTFIIFNAKRKQRIIKVITPEENTTVAFTKTIGTLYYETKDHSNLIDKKITYFLEYIRRYYLIDTQLLDKKFIKLLALKANKTKEDTTQLIDLIVNLRAQQAHNEQNLLDLNKAIEDFYNN